MSKSVSFVVLALLVSASAYADQAPAGPIIGRATSTMIEQECVAPGSCVFRAFVTQKLYLDGVLGSRQAVCSGQGIADITNGPCGPTSWLGNCQKTSVPYSSKSGSISGTVTFCNNDHTGRCQSVEGHFDATGRVLADFIQQAGGCQY